MTTSTPGGRRAPSAAMNFTRRAAVALVLALSGCNSLFYAPDRLTRVTADRLGTPVEEVWFTARDGTRLHGWFLPAAGPARGTVVHFHGNAQNLTGHVPLVSWLPAAGYHVLTFDYRGYGRSDGAPSREGLFQDAQAALGWARSRRGVDPTRLLVLGQSLGGAVALAALGEGGAAGVRGIAVEGTFADYEEMAHAASGGCPLTWPFVWLLVSGAHEPVDSLERLEGIPLLVIHGDADAVVPLEQGRAVYAAAPGPRQLLQAVGGGHLDALADPDGRAALLEFFARCLGEEAR